MKKILTFLMMFVTTAGILSAQVPQLPSNEPNGSQDHSDAPDYEESDGPTLSYQFVVRDESNNLVVDQDVNVEVRIESTGATADDVYPYFENFEALHTNHNGMLSLTLGGEGRDGSLTAVNWATARVYITVTETNGNRLIMQFEEPVYAVPYALQSSFLLTTPQIVDYVAEWSGHGEEDVDAIVAALRSNQPFLTTIRDTVVEYVKNHFDISKRVVRHYMHKVSGDDVREAYNYYETRLDADVKAEIVKCVKKYLKRHRSMAMELAKYYLRTTNAAEIDALYAKLTANTAVYDFATEKVDAVLDDYLRTIGLDPQCLATYHFDNICDLQAAADNMSNDPSDTCPRITSFTNTSNDGLVALALNGGIIMTAYVKNYSENKVTAYGMRLSEDGVTYEPRTVHYIPLTGNFGKLVDTMNLTNYCRAHLYSQAYLTVTDVDCQITENTEVNDEYNVPGYTFTIQKEGNTLKTVFSPNEAQQFFSSRRPNNVKWYVNDVYQQGKDGLEFDVTNIDLNSNTVRAHAFLRDCTYDAEYHNN